MVSDLTTVAATATAARQSSETDIDIGQEGSETFLPVLAIGNLITATIRMLVMLLLLHSHLQVKDQLINAKRNLSTNNYISSREVSSN